MSGAFRLSIYIQIQFWFLLYTPNINHSIKYFNLSCHFTRQYLFFFKNVIYNVNKVLMFHTEIQSIGVLYQEWLYQEWASIFLFLEGLDGNS